MRKKKDGSDTSAVQSADYSAHKFMIPRSITGEQLSRFFENNGSSLMSKHYVDVSKNYSISYIEDSIAGEKKSKFQVDNEMQGLGRRRATTLFLEFDTDGTRIYGTDGLDVPPFVQVYWKCDSADEVLEPIPKVAEKVSEKDARRMEKEAKKEARKNKKFKKDVKEALKNDEPDVDSAGFRGEG